MPQVREHAVHDDQADTLQWIALLVGAVVGARVGDGVGALGSSMYTAGL